MASKDFVKRREPTTIRSRTMEDRKLPLFPTRRLDYRDVRQQLILGCALPAAIAAKAHVCEKQVRLGIKDQPGALGSNPVEVKSWFDGETERSRFSADRLVRVEFFEFSQRLSPLLYFDGLGHPRFAFSDDGAGWVSYIEKAYAMVRGNHVYENLDALDALNPDRSRKPQDPPSVQRIMIDLMGPIDFADMSTTGKEWLFQDIADPAVGGVDKPLTRTLLKNMLKRADRYATVATTPSRNATADRLGLVTFHTYAVISFKGDTVKLFNALASIGAREPEIAFDDFWKAFDGVYQARRHSACGRNRGRAKRDR
jgi:hypothetical protein